MKKSKMIVVSMFLFVVLLICTQAEGLQIDGARGQAGITLGNDGKQLRISTTINKVSFLGTFEGTINGKPIEFRIQKLTKPDEKSGSFLEKEISVMKAGIDTIGSTIKSEKYEIQDIRFTHKADGYALLLSGKSLSGTEVAVTGKFAALINKEPLEFKQESDDIIVNNGNKLSDVQIQLIELAIDVIKAML